MRSNQTKRMLAAMVLGLAAMAGGLNVRVGAAGVVSITIGTIDCEGNACAQVMLTWDETKQQYLAQNNSADRAVRVEGANWAGGASVRVAPGKSNYLAIKNIVGAYHANYE